MGKTEKKASKPKAKAELKKIVPPARPSAPIAGMPIAIPSFAPPVPAPKPRNPATEFVIAALAGIDADANFGAARKTMSPCDGAWWLEGDWDNCTVGAFIRYARTH